MRNLRQYPITVEEVLETLEDMRDGRMFLDVGGTRGMIINSIIKLLQNDDAVARQVVEQCRV